MLLVLDNFEHVMDAADVVAGICVHRPASRVIVTSRAPLHVTGEQEYPGRARWVGRTRAPRRASSSSGPGPSARTGIPAPMLPVIDEVCRLLDGLPLGVELAAARVALLPLAAIRDRLAAHLPLPGSGPRDAPARQRTLEGAVAWSHDLLEPRLQRVLHRLSVFDGTFDAGAGCVGRRR